MPQPVFITDGDWSALEGDACRVTSFTANATVDDGRVSGPPVNKAYASFTFECSQLPEEALGFVTHKLDFLHLWTAFNERRDDEEVIVFWVKSDLRKSVRLFSRIMPRLVVWICRKEAFELMTDRNFKPELDGLARHKAMSPLANWTPPVMQSYDAAEVGRL
jgi:hypothetical protein